VLYPSSYRFPSLSTKVNDRTVQSSLWVAVALGGLRCSSQKAHSNRAIVRQIEQESGGSPPGERGAGSLDPRLLAAPGKSP